LVLLLELRNLCSSLLTVLLFQKACGTLSTAYWLTWRISLPSIVRLQWRLSCILLILLLDVRTWS